MVETVLTKSDATVKLRVVLSINPQTHPSYYVYFRNGDVFLCWHAVYFISEKNGNIILHWFIKSRHLTTHYLAFTV